ncbi:MAG: MFS transporter [Synechococcales bacterium]|nr:MFS transporter [Synechococcales bacterium]
MPNPPHQFVKLCVLVAAGCLTTMTGGIVSPVLPEIVQQLSLDPRWAGTLVSAHALAIALFTPVLGILADRIGKLRVLIPSLLLYSLFGVSGAFMPSLLPLLATRILLGISSAGIAAASIGLLGTMYEGEARTRILGYATSAMTTASILIPMLGGWAGSFNWRFAFYLYALGVPTALLALIILEERRSRKSSLMEAGQGRKLSRIVRQRSVLKLYLTVILAAAVVYAVVIYTPLYLKQIINAGPALNGFVLGIRAVGAAVMSAVGASYLAKHLGTNRTIGLGFVTMGLMLGTIPFLNDLWLILPAAVLFGMGFGVAIPNVYDGLSNLSPPELRSSVLAVGTGMNSLGQFISPLILGPVWKFVGLPMVFYTAAIVALLLGLLIWSEPDRANAHS